MRIGPVPGVLRSLNELSVLYRASTRGRAWIAVAVTLRDPRDVQ